MENYIGQNYLQIEIKQNGTQAILIWMEDKNTVKFIKEQREQQTGNTHIHTQRHRLRDREHFYNINIAQCHWCSVEWSQTLRHIRLAQSCVLSLNFLRVMGFSYVSMGFEPY